MATVEIDGFKLYQHLDGKLSIVIESDRINECMRYYHEKKLGGIIIRTAFDDYKLQNIDFLADHTEIQRISISDGIKNVNSLHSLKNLNNLILSSKNKIDFDNFPFLEKLVIDWSENLINLGNCDNLKDLTLWGYNPKTKDCSFISNITWLKRLDITRSTIRKLNGLEKLKSLEKLEFYYCNKLEILDCLETSKESLAYLFFDHCKSIINHEYVTRLHHLYTLAFNDCGAIPSIKFINTMPSLKDIRFMGTDVTDGDMTPCIGFKYAAFTNKKHFTHTMEQVEKLSETQS